jgi:hypothetical protein
MTELERGPGKLAYLPTYDELTFIPEDDDLFIEKLGGRLLAEHMRILGLELWQDAAGDYWLGLGSQEIHEHDRWFYQIPGENVRRTSGWGLTTFRGLIKCHGAYIAMPTNILDEISTLGTRLVYIRTLMQLQSEVDRERITLNLMLGYRMFNELNNDGMVALARGRWTPETHEILNHFPEWRAAQGLEEMPTELILNTYGLGWYAEDAHLA